MLLISTMSVGWTKREKLYLLDCLKLIRIPYLTLHLILRVYREPSKRDIFLFTTASNTSKSNTNA